VTEFSTTNVFQFGIDEFGNRIVQLPFECFECRGLGAIINYAAKVKGAGLVIVWVCTTCSATGDIPLPPGRSLSKVGRKIVMEFAGRLGDRCTEGRAAMEGLTDAEIEAGFIPDEKVH